MPNDPTHIRLLVLDVDGVMTDGSIIVDEDGRELKRFNVRDGFAIKLWMKLGFGVAVITGRSCKAVEHRLKYLGIEHAVHGSADKRSSLDAISRLTGVPREQMAFLGDDWPDLPAMRLVGHAIAVADAEPEVIAAAAYVTERPGGRGAVRDAIMHLIDTKGLRERAMSSFTERQDRAPA
jgi:3-deoxy-D-manno-octulosonate 8-phosphate phosphatase (KDO 8-P phosphatase)